MLRKNISFVIHEIQALYISLPPCFLPMCASFHLRGKEALKWTPRKTINNNNNKALSWGTTHLSLKKKKKKVTNPIRAIVFPVDKSNQICSMVHLGQFSPGKFLLSSMPLMNWTCLKSVILCPLCFLVHWGNSLVQPRSISAFIVSEVCVVREWIITG